MNIKGLSISGLFPPAKDTEWIGKPAISLNRYTDEQIALLGRSVIPVLSSGFSGQGAALAYHLKSTGTNFTSFVFNRDQTLEMIENKPINEFNDKVTSVSGRFEIIRGTCDFTREAAVYSYIAASLFRLFSKPALSYVKSWFSILNGFRKFYGESSQFMNAIVPLVLTEAAVLKYWFNVEVLKIVMLYRILYMSNVDESCMSLKSFLYDNYLSYSGMHIVSIVKQLSEVLKCGMESIMSVINVKEMEKQVECLGRVLGFLNGNDVNYRRNMWRYGRVLDEMFMSKLQMKSCLKLVCILAEALRSEEPKKHKGILQIAQLADVSEDNKRRCVIVAQRLLSLLKGQNPRGASSSTFGPYSSRNYD